MERRGSEDHEGEEEEMEVQDEADTSGEEFNWSGSEETTEEGSYLASQVKGFFSELNIGKFKQKKQLLDSGVKVPRRKSILPPHLRSVMGSANLRLARKDTAGAMELCKEVIRQAPHSCEAYLTLATVYEELQDETKLLQILLIAAHLKRTDKKLWLKAAEVAKKQEEFRVAVQCVTKGIVLDPKNVELQWERASLYSKLGDSKKAIEYFEQTLKVLPSQAMQEYVEINKELAALYHDVNNTPKAVEVLGGVLVSHPLQVDQELINILAELCIISKAYEQAYEVICGFYQMIPPPVADEGTRPHEPSLSSLPLTTALRMSISGEDMELGPDPLTGREQSEERGTCGGRMSVPGDMPVDLRAKLAVAMINLEEDIPAKLVQPIFSSPEDYGDLCLDIGDAYINNGKYSLALPLLTALVGTTNYCQAGVWLKHAECQYMLNDLEGAAISYSKVLTLAPHHTDTRLQLATLYVQMGQADDALMVLESDPNSDKADESVDTSQMELFSTDQVEVAETGSKETSTQDVRLTVHKHKLLYSTGKLKEYVKTGCTLLAVLFRDVYKHPEIKVLMKLKIKRRKSFRSQLMTCESKKDEAANLLTPLEWFKLFRETCIGLLKLGTPSSHYQMTYFIYCAVITSKFTEELAKPFTYLSVSLSCIVKDHGTMFMLLKDMCWDPQERESKHLWNIINQINLDDVSRKFMIRLCHKQAGTLVLRILANLSMVSLSSSVRFCLTQFEKEFREGGNKDYLLSLCIAAVYINLTCQVKNSPNKNGLVTMALGFLHTYSRLRGECQESMYNMGRAFHQLGILHVACHYYKKVLIMEPECKLPQWRMASDLRSEAAFNLSLIYRASGNLVLARDMLIRYCTI